ncbi:integral membrane protein, partial [Colletotrichum musicola]
LRSSQERSKYGAYSNPIDKSSKRQRGGVHTFELPSRDDLPGGCASRSGRDDDEAKLWPHGKGMQGKRTSTQKTEPDLGSDKKDNDSIDSVEAQYPGRVGPAIVVTSWGRGSEGLQTPTKGINVTRETKVSYDRQ